MQSLNAAAWLWHASKAPVPNLRRSASLTSAIGRGIRRSQRGFEVAEKRARGPLPDKKGTGSDHKSVERDSWKRTRQTDHFQREEPAHASRKERRAAQFSDEYRNQVDGQAGGTGDRRNEDRRLDRKRIHGGDADQSSTPERTVRPSMKVPLAVPYTTAGSEFIYGTNAVKAAILAGRRKIYKLYIYRGPESDEAQGRSLQNIAKEAGIDVRVVRGEEWSRMMAKMSDSRLHNGVVLEAAPIPKLPITGLRAVEENFEVFGVDLDHQTAEQAMANSFFNLSGTAGTIPRINTDRYPLVLMLDRILDPGNLGAIIRSAYFLGAEAVVMVDHGSSPLSAVAIKASSGAAEHFPILTVKKEGEFIHESKKNGWKFYAAVSADFKSSSNRKVETQGQLGQALESSPCVLMMGNEGEGLRPWLQQRATGFARIWSSRGLAHGVDSLNVSVAAAILMHEFLRPLKVAGAKPAVAEAGQGSSPAGDQIF